MYSQTIPLDGWVENMNILKLKEGKLQADCSYLDSLFLTVQHFIGLGVFISLSKWILVCCVSGSRCPFLCLVWRDIHWPGNVCIYTCALQLTCSLFKKENTLLWLPISGFWCCLIHKSTSVKKQTFAIVNRIFKAISSRDMSQSLIDVLLRPHTLWQGSVVTLRMQMHICLTFSIFREGGLVNCSLCSRRYCQSWTISSEWESVFTVALSPNLPHSRNWGCIC